MFSDRNIPGHTRAHKVLNMRVNALEKSSSMS